MGRIWVREFTGGLDTRRLPETTPGGVLIKGQDGHINSGGEFESRAAFVSTYSLPAGTIGMGYTSTGLLVFGHGTAPVGMPSGVSYMRLQKGAKVLVKVLSFDLFGGKAYVVAEYDDGTIVHFYDGAEVTDWFDGRARASFRVTAGVTGQLDSLTVNGVELLGSAVPWNTSHPQTAADIAAEINSQTTSPDYEASSVDDRVNVIASAAGAAVNGRVLTFGITGDLELTPASGIEMAGGADSTTTFVPGTFVRTIGSKMYAVSNSLFHFSGIREPTKWTTETTGAGFVDMAFETSGAEELLAVANYQGFVAIFAEEVILVFYVDPDPDLVRKVQTLRNTGTVSPRSVTEFGDSDLFYLALSGCRSLKARDSSNSAVTTDIGVPIDSLIIAKLAAMTAEERQGVIGLINPGSGRFWLCFPDEIFVFSFFPNAKVSAWTTYTPSLTAAGVTTTFEIEQAIVFNRHVHIRSGNTIYVYGGLDDAVYDETVAKAWLPFLEADKPSEFKQWNGMDAALEGDWRVYMAQQPTDVTIREQIATLTETTFNRARTPFDSATTHVSPHFESSGVGPHKLSSMVLHYVDGEDG